MDDGKEITRTTFVRDSRYPDRNSFPVCDMDQSTDFIDPLLLHRFHSFAIDNINEEGLYALGGKLTPELLIKSYSRGIFPWYAFRLEEIYWYCPRSRFVIFPEKIHIGHSMRNLINKKRYHITINRNFEEVINGCSKVDNRYENENAWLGEEIIKNFLELHRRGLAVSVEVWNEDKLAGGFYGVWMKGVFQGESMFSLEPSASRFGLVSLCLNPYINGEKIKFIDTQFETPNFKHLGGEYIPYTKYREIMDF